MGGAWSVPAARESTREDEQARNARGQSKRRGDHCAPDYDGKRVRSCDIGGASGSIVRYNGSQLDCSDEETESLLFSCNPRAAASGNGLEPLGSRVDVQQFSSFKIDPTKHKIFLSHSGVQKNFVEQLCVDLEARGYCFAFFDQRHHSLPKGKDFAPLTKQAARGCRVAVIVLSKEFLSSKWPMIELAEFHIAKGRGNHGMNLLPLFYKLRVGDLDEESINERWMPKWNELARKDERIVVSQWAAAVRGLRGVNGLEFGKNTNSEVAVGRKLYKVCGSCRLETCCMIVVERWWFTIEYVSLGKQFVEASKVGALVLGLYGVSGLGKTTVSKALCDYFARDFVGKVCQVDMEARTRMERQALMLKTLCGIEEGVLSRLTDVPKGLKLMRDCMNWEPVFLVIDNVTNDESSRKEAHEYLTVGFHEKSKIMITARSKSILQDLLPREMFCMGIPKLNEEEVGMIFLKSAAPMRCFFELTDEERGILGLCVQKCLLEAYNDESDIDETFFLDLNPYDSSLTGIPRFRAYHPLALSALGDIFYRFGSNSGMLRWKDSLEENTELMRDFLQSASITSIISLQFSTLSLIEQLLFLDNALFIRQDIFSFDERFINLSFYDSVVEWLCALHGETASVIERHLQDLKRSGMIVFGEKDSALVIEVHSLYREFAVWYVTENGVTGLKNAWGVFQSYGSRLRFDHQGPKCISDLVRLRVFDSPCMRILPSKRMPELPNLVLLQLHRCTQLRVLNLEGLDSLRHLELVGLPNLVTVTFTGRLGSGENGGILESLLYVKMEDLDSLTQVPEFRSCTSLHHLAVWECPKVKSFVEMEGPQLKVLNLEVPTSHQLGELPHFRSLQWLRILHVHFQCDASLLYIANPYISKEETGDFSFRRTYIYQEDQVAKEGLTIAQKVLQYVNEQDWSERCTRRCFMKWRFIDNERESLWVENGGCFNSCIEWCFKAPEEDGIYGVFTANRIYVI